MQSSGKETSREEISGKKRRLDPVMASDPGDGEVAAGIDLPLPVVEIVRYPLPGYEAPMGLSFSPDDRRIAFLFSPDGTLHCSLFVFDTSDGRQELLFAPPDGSGLQEGNLSAEERLRRERAREQGLGVTYYEWRFDSDSGRDGIVVPLPSGVYFQDFCGSEPELKLKGSPSSSIIDPHLSPCGCMIAFIKDDELYSLEFSDGEIRQLSFGARESGKIHGLAEYIAQEEMERKMGFWWSPDSENLAFTEVDSSEVPLYRVMHQGKNCVGPIAQEDHPYPFAGEANAKVRLGVVPSHGGEITWMDVVCGEQNNSNGREEEYLARVNWMHNNALAVQVLNRDHTKLKLLKCDVTTGKREVLLEEKHNVWVTIHDCFTPLFKGANSKYPDSFIWASEKTGFRHLYLHDKYGTCLGPLTRGDWMVEQVVAINECTELQLSPETIQISAKDGTTLYANMYLPDEKQFGPPPYRTLISVYGGPSVQLVYDSWSSTVDMRAQYLRNKGILVWKLDNRGTARRGLQFEGQLKHNVGRVDAEDQLTGAEWLMEHGLSVRGHIGLYGWSYGGFLSAMCLARFPDVFSCAVAGAPVTAWDGYDTFYTEKYMGLPSENKDVYEFASIMHHVNNLKGKLLLVHGTIDENVHFRHTARLINSLIAARKPYDMLIFPDERHMPRGICDRIYMEERIQEFLDRNL
ncbi:hypothetical protein U9M48_027751 [Paspalum notatum var. saurae]|uniref:Uncharacterized protein n=1 Tax=Paspalum notatum var. saurae TaxID=547442 RepID=A0AAQ3TX08_PASNO